jgi:hypothetical protein
MAIAAKILRILFFSLMVLQVAGWCYKNMYPATPAAQLCFLPNQSAALPEPENATENTQNSEVLYSPDKLLLPDALLSPIPSFQFGVIEILACFLFTIFCFCACIQVKEKPFYFTSSYFHTLFLSVILINAP